MNLYLKLPCGEEAALSFSAKQVLTHQLSGFGSEKIEGKAFQLFLGRTCAGGSQQSLKEKVNLLVNKWLPHCGGGVQIIRGMFG